MSCLFVRRSSLYKGSLLQFDNITGKLSDNAKIEKQTTICSLYKKYITQYIVHKILDNRVLGQPPGSHHNAF